MTLRKPAAPAIQEVSPYDESDGMSVKFTIEPKTLMENTLCPNYLYYNVYFDTDTKPMTFTEDIYSGLDEDMTDIPYLFEDKEFFYVQGNTHLSTQRLKTMTEWAFKCSTKLTTTLVAPK